MTNADWDRLTPAQKQAALAELTRLGQLNSESTALDDQISNAVALRSQGPQREGYGIAGGLLTGLGDGLRQVASVVRENKLRGDQSKKLEEIAALRKNYGALIIPTEQTNMDAGPKQVAMDDEIRPATMIGPEQAKPAPVELVVPARRRDAPVTNGIPPSVLRAMGLL